jgi:hypothetical protein
MKMIKDVSIYFLKAIHVCIWEQNNRKTYAAIGNVAVPEIFQCKENIL